MKRSYKPKRISTIIVLYFSLFMAAILLAMSFISYYYSFENMRSRTIADTEVILSQVGKNIGRYISNIRNISSIVNANRDVLNYLEEPNAEEAGLWRTNFSSYLNYLPQIDRNIVSVFVFDKNNKPIYVPSSLRMKMGYDITQDEWYGKIANETTAKSYITGTEVRTMTEGENPWVISLSRRILNNANGEVVGSQLVELDYRAIDEILSDINLGSKGYVFIIDEKGDMVYHPQLQLIYSELKKENVAAVLNAPTSTVEIQEEGKLYNIAHIPETDFLIVGVMFVDEIVATANEMIVIYLIVTLIMALVAFSGAVQLAKYVTRPLSKLELSVNEVEKGNLDANFEIKGTYETEKFATSLGDMVSTVKQLMEQIVEDQEMIRTSELKALQSQINPHFLYNTLDSIVWIAEEAGNEQIKDITMALASYFRIVLSSGKDIIKVKEEVEHVRNYLVIQKMRYELLDYTIEIGENVESLYMPKLLLQPLVENAIYHGIKNNPAGGLISISASIEKNNLVFKIRDNGRGLRPHELKNVFEAPKKQRIRHSGVALRNIKERIELYYGTSYGIEIDSVYRQGTTVTLTLPIRTTLETEYHYGE